jgi:hypothetical protein
VVRKISARLRELASRHAALERLVAEEQRRPQPDALRLQVLKRRKLALRDQIAAISGPLQTAA